MELTDRSIARLCFRILQHLPKKTKTTQPPKYSTPLQHSSTALLYSTPLQHSSTALVKATKGVFWSG